LLPPLGYLAAIPPPGDDSGQGRGLEIEADETHIGGKDKIRRWAKKSCQQREDGTGEGYLKTGVIGVIAPNGNVVSHVIGDQDARTLSGFVRKVIVDKVDLVATNENREYSHLGLGIPHESVRHKALIHLRPFSSHYSIGSVPTNRPLKFVAFKSGKDAGLDSGERSIRLRQSSAE
jgi:hypothetical protein